MTSAVPIISALRPQSKALHTSTMRYNLTTVGAPFIGQSLFYSYVKIWAVEEYVMRGRVLMHATPPARLRNEIQDGLFCFV